MTPKIKNSITWVLAALLAVVFIASGITKLLGVEMQIKNLESWGYPLWLRFPIGLCEIAIAVTLLLPTYRKQAIYAIFIWVIVAVITHLQAGQASMIGAPVLFGAIAVIIYFLIREKTKIALQ